jgi:hypothetical protein
MGRSLREERTQQNASFVRLGKTVGVPVSQFIDGPISEQQLQEREIWKPSLRLSFRGPWPVFHAGNPTAFETHFHAAAIPTDRQLTRVTGNIGT